MGIPGRALTSETRAKISASLTGRTMSPETKAKLREGKTKHGHNLVNPPTYRSWHGMRQRCHDPNASNFHHYGGRGITVCGRWDRDFRAFLDDMGERPEGTSLDQIGRA